MIELDRNMVLEQLGFSQGKSEVSEDIDVIIDEEIKSSQKIIIPRKIIKMCELSLHDDKSVILCSSLAIQSKSLNQRLRGCLFTYLFAVTIGDLLTKKMNEYTRKGEITRATIIDAIGSVAVERYADIVDSEIQDLCIKSGYVTTKRFSPGYGDWSITGQKSFLELIDAKKIQIELNDNFQMSPEKSISAIIGVKG